MDPACPWSSFAPTAASFCEASLCAWVRQPGNTWTNIGFVVFAIVCYRLARRPDLRHLRPVAHITLITGLGSAFFHASETLVGAAGDYLGLFLGSAFMLMVCLRRWTGCSRLVARVFFGSLIAVPLIAFVFVPTWARWIYAGLGTVCALSDTVLAIRDRKVLDFTWFIAGWIAFSVAMAAWVVDLEGVICNPDNHLISGHGVWHLVNGVGFFCTFLYYRQFQILRRGDAVWPTPRP